MTAWKHGALLSPENTSTHFRIWAPLASNVKIVFVDRDNMELPMESAEYGYFQLTVPDCPPGTRYLYQIDNDPPRPDPASRFQPEGVHGPSAVTDTHFQWSDNDWAGIPLEEYVIYELHIGTFTDDGTFDAAIAELPRLKELGITAVEIMPIAQFPGDRNWGYDGVYMYAPQKSYGGLAGFQRLVDAAHNLQMAVVLDVVYNHIGPEGNYLACFGPYFTDTYHTPWGSSLNFDGPYSDGVRDFFIGNALFWMDCCHVDALRLDAVHAIIDTSADPFLHQLTDAVHLLGRRLHKRVHVTGENDRNDPKFTRPPEIGGVGADSQWSDDFHHALHAILTGENHGYYRDFGAISQLAKACTDGFVFDGCYSPGRRRHHGADSRDLPGIRFIACSQNHDQVGNRPNGERLSMLLDFSQLKVAAVALLCAPYIPLIFMGEETASKSPFLYFVSHSDTALIEAVRDGRAREFHEFFAAGKPVDPQSEESFFQSKVKPDTTAEGIAVNRLYKKLLKLRREIEPMKPLNKRHTTAAANDLRRTLVLNRATEQSTVLCFFNFADGDQQITLPADIGEWRLLLDTESPEYEGTGNQIASIIESRGEISLTLCRHSAIILHHQHPQPVSNQSHQTTGP